MDWVLKPLKEICTIEKGSTGITKAKPGPYPLVTLAEDRKEHDEYQFDAKAVIIPLVSSTGHGHASLKRIHYQEGKFALGTILCAVIPKDENTIHPLFLYHYLDVFKERLLVSLMRGMANVTLPIKSLQELEIPVPPIKDQLEWVEKFKSVNAKETLLLNELTHQQTLLKQLRQTILQEAVQGKLTKEWRQAHPDVDPASVLLEKIKAEKARLVQEKKIKKQKPLPPITPDEIPFPLPEGWVWCRLGDLAEKIHYGFTASAKPIKKDVRLLRITDIQNNNVDWPSVPGCDYSPKDLEVYLLAENDIVIARTGGTIGKSYIIKNIPVKSLFASYLIRVVPSKDLNPDFLKLFIESPIYWEQLYNAAWGAGQPNVNSTSLTKLSVSFPPLEEQQAIVEKVEKLVAKVSELEEEVQQNQQRAGQLLQSVLREVMQPDAARPGVTYSNSALSL